MADGRYPLPDDVTHRRRGPPAGRRAVARGAGGLPRPRARAWWTRRRFARALGEALAAAGVKIHENAEVTGFRSAGGRVTALRTDAGRDLPAPPSSSRPACGPPACCAASGSGCRSRRARATASRVDLDPAPAHTLYFGERRAVASPIGGTTRIAGTMELSGNNRRLDWRRIVAVALASRHYLGPWFDDPDDLVALIRDPWVGGRPFLPDGLPVHRPGPGHAQRLRGHRPRHARRHARPGHRPARWPTTSSPAVARPSSRPSAATGRPFRFPR